MIERKLEYQIIQQLNDHKVIILLGSRQVGKTTLLEKITGNKKDTLWWNGDESDLRELLRQPTSTQLQKLIGSHTTLVIDEAQRIENIGLCLKLIHDNIKTVKVIATGSSSFELANKINEPMTGRKWEFMLYPFSFEEMVNKQGLLEEKRLLEHRLLYGYYPDVVNNPGKEQAILKQLSDSYLYKDILTWERVQKPDRLEKLIQALAFQVGSQVSYHELGQMAGLDNQTVEHYIDLLEKAFVIFRLSTFSRNLRNELKKSRKIYFYDNGIRNAVINQFNPINLRNDKGALWENFIISERVKYCSYNNIYCNRYFWRNHAQNEIDYIEERNGEIHAYEFKWVEKSAAKFPKAFIDAYQPTTTQIVSPENYIDFISS